jgi:hypothetical protein
MAREMLTRLMSALICGCVPRAISVRRNAASLEQEDLLLGCDPVIRNRTADPEFLRAEIG